MEQIQKTMITYTRIKNFGRRIFSRRRPSVRREITLIKERLDKIQMNQEELQQALADLKAQRELDIERLDAVSGQLTKIQQEVQALIDAIGSTELPQEVADAVASLKAASDQVTAKIAEVAEKSQTVDDQNPDTPPEENPEA